MMVGFFLWEEIFECNIFVMLMYMLFIYCNFLVFMNEDFFILVKKRMILL